LSAGSHSTLSSSAGKSHRAASCSSSTGYLSMTEIICIFAPPLDRWFFVDNRCTNRQWHYDDKINK
ncbi:MAG: hypothetical protein II088_04675, partial [Bacteroidales bacterium]|nr:hypothetical protein [Bacteroidales bacterium]